MHTFSPSFYLLMLAAVLSCACFSLLVAVQDRPTRKIRLLAEAVMPVATLGVYLAATAAAISALFGF
jgi:hypothetical protein